MERVRKTVDLLDTMSEGMGYVNAKLQTYDLASAAMVMRDMIEALLTIEQALMSLSDVVEASQMAEMADADAQLQNALEHLVDAWTEGNATHVQEFFQISVQPAFNIWREMMDRILLPKVQV